MSEHADVLAAVLRAFRSAGTDSRVLLTSRHTFGLDGLENTMVPIQLPELSEVARRKLVRRQRDAATDPDRRDRLATEQLDERAHLFARVPGIARGNPGLQDLIGVKIVLSPHIPVDQAKQTLDDMDAWLDDGDLPADDQAREFLENLAIDTLHQQAGDAGRALLRSLRVFDVSVPEPVADIVADTVGGRLDRLRGLGVVDVFDDIVDRRVTAVAVIALSAARLVSPTDQDHPDDPWNGRPASAVLRLPSVGALKLSPG